MSLTVALPTLMTMKIPHQQVNNALSAILETHIRKDNSTVASYSKEQFIIDKSFRSR
jgi:hypothetical protein